MESEIVHKLLLVVRWTSVNVNIIVRQKQDWELKSTLTPKGISANKYIHK